MTDWSKPSYPGDTVRITRMRRGDELGDVRIQFYGPDAVRCAAFLPGYCVSLPGDTPKVEPEIAAWWNSKVEADACFDNTVADALADGWSES